MVSQAQLPFRTIDIRNREGAAALANQLIKHGYRSAAILTGPTGLLTAQERALGFADAFAAAGYPIDETVAGARRFHPGRWVPRPRPSCGDEGLTRSSCSSP